MSEYDYAGEELELFAGAVRWKAYCRERLARFIRGDVLEVGAGIGGTTAAYCDGTQASWLCLEPDARMAADLAAKAAGGAFAIRPEVIAGTLAELPQDRRFDSILYIDVLEHIEDDRGELARAAGHLREGGHLVVLCPAHDFLFTPFDRAIGHFRRYNRRMFRAIAPPGLTLEVLDYMDSAGMLLSLGNRLLLRSSMPSSSQIRIWDRVFVPVSRRLDPVFGRRLGKSVVAVWSRRS
ncbi:Methyltransferase domain protein [Aquisphaera giovannonii]|uniref:Methyltransferase domain protein n=1 Tax=Aquisphaera giovannonii TaxID=406548 RepID=A0A5B9WBV6_9BACT|nr:class I SAM-dependent methyltransferase [Aquisphaera giovannonii]QEH37997.1 Methyltransferase domain protein [Aquisphaera giovannonii]